MLLWGAHFIHMCITFRCVILVVVNYAHSSYGFYEDILRVCVPCGNHSRKKRHFTQIIHSWRRGNEHLNLSQSSCSRAFEWFSLSIEHKIPHVIVRLLLCSVFDWSSPPCLLFAKCDNRFWSVFLKRRKRRPLTTEI